MIADAIATPGRHGTKRGKTFDEMAIERIAASDEWQQYSDALWQELESRGSERRVGRGIQTSEQTSKGSAVRPAKPFE